MLNLLNYLLCARLDWAFATSAFVIFMFRSFFFFFSMQFGVTWLLFIHCSLKSNHQCWLFHSEQCICALFMDPQNPLFSNFFITNGSHNTIHTFKNYFATVFSVFSFSKISFIQIDPMCVEVKNKKQLLNAFFLFYILNKLGKVH